jgi:hypothetical protein
LHLVDLPVKNWWDYKLTYWQILVSVEFDCAVFNVLCFHGLGGT